jgi:hypothetical protein
LCVHYRLSDLLRSDSLWTAAASVLGNTSGQTAHSGTRYAWLDGYGVTSFVIDDTALTVS